MENNSYNQILKIELDLLLLFYTFSDQYGNVDIRKCQQWAKERMGIYLPDSPFQFTQEHVDVLVRHNLVPDVMIIIDKIKKINK